MNEMKRRSIRASYFVGAGVAGTLVAGTASAAFLGIFIGNVPNANKAEGVQGNVISPRYALTRVASGSDPVENPSGVITSYGALSTGVPTEPDENLYLELPGRVAGPTPGYDYGHTF